MAWSAPTHWPAAEYPAAAGLAVEAGTEPTCQSSKTSPARTGDARAARFRAQIKRVELLDFVFGQLLVIAGRRLFADCVQGAVHERGVQIEARIFGVEPALLRVGKDRDFAEIGDRVPDALDIVGRAAEVDRAAFNGVVAHRPFVGEFEK